MTSAPVRQPATTRLATTRRYLMCEPTYFAVEYSINPWMDPTRPVSTEGAIAEWAALKQTYERLGHVVETIAPQPGLPDMVFSANSGTVIDGVVLGSRFRAPQRAAEADFFRTWFLDHGYRDIVMPEKINEAEGDLTWTGDLLLAGTGFRTDPGAHAEAQEVLGVPVVSLQLVDPRYYHLDVALVVLAEATPGSRAHIAYYPAAFSPGTQRLLRRLYPDAILATEEDAACLGLNAVSDGHNVVIAKEATTLAAQLEAHGYTTHNVDITELRKSGGGPKCCTMEIRG
ncbi:N-dimethylarginine dimethylaminohydrolase [Actinokineospora baliensis]|uniref:dimethylargininase n=1 Tax=Actinokineospora baliensis TaxID=547056 RepID=UPI001EF82836|nr:dimethylargininase [Actinokineospora baliensis]MBM7770417.1 N-dimethylarginine dimethylaminohydrolase [Actinokineospora baliensis]